MSSFVHINDERWDFIRKLIVDIASGNFDLPPFEAKHGDELDNIIKGILMVSEERRISSVSREYLDSVIAGITDLLLVLDEKFRIVEYNQAVQDFLDVKADALLETDFWQLCEAQPNVSEAVKTLVVGSRGKVENIRMDFKGAGNTQTPFSASISYISSNHTPRHNVLVIAKNVSDLVETQSRLEESNSELTTLIYRLSHDIRSPLANIIGLVDLMFDFTESLDENNNIVFYSLLEKLHISAKKIDSILHFFNRLSVIQSELGAEDVSLKELFANLENELAFKFDGIPVSFRYDLKVDAVEMNCSRLLLTLMVLQVLDNCYRYRDENRPLEIEVHTEVTERDVVLSIQDNGQGIPENIKDDVFNMFVRGHNDNDHPGMGLFFVKSSINQIMGKVELASEEGKGTSITFRIPIAKSDKGVEQAVKKVAEQV